uniref:39S ribosomal protein L46, mitochondrial-like n=1 Tax=Dermatophagoides pteronyssinus TaxID=6956 RepID=A0A6P6XQS2_DERPT|nr:39S ribosomal protein L46, mitochondrial-like [Dermatophagoides pteronyssinus]
MSLQRVSLIRLIRIDRFCPKIFNRSISSNNNNPSSQWDLFAGICLQRCPLIVPELNWLEKRAQNMFNKIELANSLYSDHEMRHFENLRRAERIASGVNVSEKDLEEAAKQTAQDFEEASIKEMKQFQFGNSVTKADLSNNEKSIDRSLDKYLYLVIKTKLGSNEHWLFPQEQYQPDQDKSLRQTAERALENCFPSKKDKSPSVIVKFLGNCPSAFYSYRYPRQLIDERQKQGARIFLFKCQLDVNEKGKHSAIQDKTFGNRILKAENSIDFSWLTRNELCQRLPERYWKQLGLAIYPDEIINIDKLIQSSKRRNINRLTKRLEKIEVAN